MGVNTLSAPVIYFSILIIAICGIIYELIIGTVSSYLWGDSIFYFSVTIGLYLSAMGLGAFLSKYVQTHLFDWFVLSEILIGLIGGCSALFLFWAYAVTDYYEYWMVIMTILIGTLVGVEVPWLIRIMENNQENLSKNVAHILGYDYIGGLLGALVFPLFLLPFLGLIKTALVLGMANLAVAVLNFIRHRQMLQFFPALLIAAMIMMGGLGYLYLTAQTQEAMIEQKLYRDKVIYSVQTQYQKLILTQWHNDIRLFINGGLQFSSLDEYRYHESLVHVPMSIHPFPRRILILGGGDGLALREVLKYSEVKQVILVDLDPAMTEISSTLATLVKLNGNSFQDQRVKIVNQDAYKFIERDSQFYDIILIDLPDPKHTALAKLYAREFYMQVKRRLSQTGIMITQSTSPFFSKEAFWCIHKTLQSTGLNVYPLQVDVPSFGNWGFQLASYSKIKPAQISLRLKANNYRFLTAQTLLSLFALPKDVYVNLETIQVNSAIQPVILKYYDKGWNAIR